MQLGDHIFKRRTWPSAPDVFRADYGPPGSYQIAWRVSPGKTPISLVLDFLTRCRLSDIYPRAGLSHVAVKRRLLGPRALA
jgi:hypothetical protein